VNGGACPQTRVKDAVLARAARLSPEGAALLEAVAVVPPQAEPWLLEALAGEVADRLDECLASGMLVAEPVGVAFRHELARLAVEASVPPHRKLGLHRAALAALAEPSAGAPDLARLAHHAEAAGDVDAVLRFAPRPPPARPRPAPTARRPRRTRGRSGSATGCRRTGARSCWSAAPTRAT
jgi:hypothetical protein